MPILAPLEEKISQFWMLNNERWNIQSFMNFRATLLAIDVLVAMFKGCYNT